jgi:hypothetical protein
MSRGYDITAHKVLGNFALMLISELESKRPDEAIIERCKTVIRAISEFEPQTLINIEKLKTIVPKDATGERENAG